MWLCDVIDVSERELADYRYRNQNHTFVSVCTVLIVAVSVPRVEPLDFCTDGRVAAGLTGCILKRRPITVIANHE